MGAWLSTRLQEAQWVEEEVPWSTDHGADRHCHAKGQGWHTASAKDDQLMQVVGEAQYRLAEI